MRGQTVSDYGRPLLLALARDAYAAAEAFMRAPTTLRRAEEVTAQLEAAGLTDIDAMWGRWGLFLEGWDPLAAPELPPVTPAEIARNLVLRTARLQRPADEPAARAMVRELGIPAELVDASVALALEVTAGEHPFETTNAPPARRPAGRGAPG